MSTGAGQGRVTVVVADDHPLYRAGLVAALAATPELAVVGEASTGRQAIDHIRHVRPDVAVLDLSLPDMSGVEVITLLEQEGVKARVVCVSARDDSTSVFDAFAAGARAFLPKFSTSVEIVEGILAVARGDTVIPPALQGRLCSQLRMRRKDVEAPALTARELEVLRLAADGLSVAAMAEQLVVSQATIKSHLQHVYQKLEVADKTAAVAAAFRHGLVV